MTRDPVNPPTPDDPESLMPEFRPPVFPTVTETDDWREETP